MAALRLWVSGAVSLAAEPKFRSLMRSFCDDSSKHEEFTFEEQIYDYNDACPGFVKGTKESDLRTRLIGMLVANHIENKSLYMSLTVLNVVGPSGAQQWQVRHSLLDRSAMLVQSKSRFAISLPFSGMQKYQRFCDACLGRMSSGTSP
jgi:hypothetical protein